MNKQDIINKTSASKPNSPHDNECKTNVYTTSSEERTVVSIRVKPEVKEALKKFCKANGLGICHVFETLVIGYLAGVNEKIELVNKSPTINLTVQRVVKRERRYAEDVNYYSKKESVWKFVPDAVLNSHGHASGCACKSCGGEKL